MKVGEIYSRNGARKVPTLSFEIYPPKKPEDEPNLYSKTLPRLQELRPDFITVTYGAGGTTKDRTLDIAVRVKEMTGLTVACHLSCLGVLPEEPLEFLDKARAAGIENIVAIRGDRPRWLPDWKPHPDGMKFGIELVRLVRKHGDWGIVAGGYPEGHPECADGKFVDWQRHREKADAGADVITTQLFYDNADFFEFDAYLKKIGVKVPIVPGVLPILSTEQIKRFSSLSGARLPPILVERLEANAADTEKVRQIGIDYAAEQVKELLSRGVPGFHFYTLNRARSVRAILEKVGLR
jgi:methylenetetrahydrofolate reductase (NADPH)